MKLTVLRAGVYNDANHRAASYEAGDTLDTAHLYGRDLIEGGHARLFAAERIEEGWTPTELPVVIISVPMETVPHETTRTALPQAEVAGGLETLESTGVPKVVVLRLRLRGLDTLAKVAAASDRELKAVPGVGPAILRRIREGTQ